MTTLSILVKVRICIIINIFNLQITVSWSARGLPLSFAHRLVTKLFCSCLFVFDAIVKLHAMMDEKTFKNFVIR